MTIWSSPEIKSIRIKPKDLKTGLLYWDIAQCSVWESSQCHFSCSNWRSIFSWVIIVLPFGLHCKSTNTNTVMDMQIDKNLTNIAIMNNRQTDGNCTNITWSVSNKVRHSCKWLSIFGISKLNTRLKVLKVVKEVS